MKEQRRGWAVLPNARKAHYFVGGKALCGGWLWMGDVEDDRHDHADNCATCRKKRERLTAPAAGEGEG